MRMHGRPLFARVSPRMTMTMVVSMTTVMTGCFCLEELDGYDHGSDSPGPSSAPPGYKPPNTTCTSNIDCFYSWQCTKGHCRPPEIPTVSRPDAGVTGPDSGNAVDGNMADAGCGREAGAGAGACRPKPAPVCQWNNECGPGGRCRDGLCERACGTDLPCGTGQVCREGFCQAPTTTGGQCVYDRTCGNHHTCINGLCHPSCQSDGDCAAQDRCMAGVCKADTGPRPECRASAECPGGQMCVNAVCRTLCTADADCCLDGVIGPTCRQGVCISLHEAKPVCRTNTECASGQSCIDAVCN
jgi:hypothetical protein